MFSRSSLWLSLLLIVGLVLVACGGKPETPTVVRIGTQPWIGYGPWWIAKEKGIFEKQGVKVELVDFVEDKEVNAAFASGEMDAANLATHTALKLYASGLNLRIVLLEDASYEADAIIAPSVITSVADLKGKKVAYEEGTTSDLLLNYALSQNGLTLNDIESVFMPAADAGAALIAGQVDVAVTYEPYISAALAENQDLRLLYTAAKRPGLISDVLAIRADLDSAITEKLLKVWDEALVFYNAHPYEAKAIIAKAVGSVPEELFTAFDGIKFYNLIENEAALKGDFLAILQDVGQVSMTIGLLDKIPNLNIVVNTSAYK